jgi:hypothetical protein
VRVLRRAIHRWTPPAVPRTPPDEGTTDSGSEPRPGLDPRWGSVADRGEAVPRLSTGPAEPGRGRRRLAVVVPAVALACGLVAGGLAGERLVSQRRAAAVPARPAEVGPLVGRASGPVEQLRGAGTVLFTDPQGRVHAQTADGRDHTVLGQLQELAARPRPLGVDQESAWRLAYPPDDRPAELAPDGDLVYLQLGDGAAGIGRLLEGSVRRLVPAGWRSPGPPRHSADGAVLGACGYRLEGRPYGGVAAARSWVLDGSGERLATLPGCLYDLSADGGQALVGDPAEGRRAGPVPTAEARAGPPMGGSSQLTRGLRLWRRADGSFRQVLGFAEVTRAFRTVQPGVDPRGLVVVTAVLAPGGRQALVRIVDVLADVDPRTGRETELLALVDLERGRAGPIPEHLPGWFAFLPTGGHVYTGGSGTLTYMPRDRPPQLLRSGVATEGVYAIVPSPDGAWVLLAGPSWRFIRADDPSVQVSYPAPGRLAVWTAGTDGQGSSP